MTDCGAFRVSHWNQTIQIRMLAGNNDTTYRDVPGLMDTTQAESVGFPRAAGWWLPAVRVPKA